jgi:hypothetical protein
MITSLISKVPITQGLFKLAEEAKPKSSEPLGYGYDPQERRL